MPQFVRLFAAVLLCPIVCQALGTEQKQPRWRSHSLSRFGSHFGLAALKKQAGECPAWCRLSQVKWEHKCKWAKCGGGCWDCQWSDSEKAYNFELAWYRKQQRVKNGEELMVLEKREKQVSDEEKEREAEREAEEADERLANLELIKKRVELQRQRDAELAQLSQQKGEDMAKQKFEVNKTREAEDAKEDEERERQMEERRQKQHNLMNQLRQKDAADIPLVMASSGAEPESDDDDDESALSR